MTPIAPEMLPISPANGSRKPLDADLSRLREQLDVFPTWLRQALDDYLTWRWPTWKRQTAYSLGYRMVTNTRRIWQWLDAHCQIAGWESLTRADLQAWLQARSQDPIKPQTIQIELNHFRMLLKFLDEHDYPIDLAIYARYSG